MYMSNFKPYAIRESLEMQINLRDYLPTDHLCRQIEKIVSELDTACIETCYSPKGQSAFHPKMLLSIIFYGYAAGIRSGRKLETACKEDLAFIYLSKNYQPGKTSINQFRSTHHLRFEGLFKQLLKKCMTLGLIDEDKDIIDGSKIAANSAMNRTKTRSTYEKWLGHLLEDIQQIEQELSDLTIVPSKENKPDEQSETLSNELAAKQHLVGKIQGAIKQLQGADEKKKLNLTDSGAPIMKGKKGYFDTFYNVQIGCDKNQLITYCDVVIDQNDKAQLIPVLSGIAENTGRPVKIALADAGYNNLDALAYMKQQNIDGYVAYEAMSTDFSDKPYHKANFKYDEQEDIYICPAGNSLSFYRESFDKSNGHTYKNYKTDACFNCPFKEQCISPSRKRRVIKREVRQYLRDQMKQKLDTPEGKQIYQQRFHPVEAIFGQLKYNLGYQQFLLRGIQKVKAEFTLMCIAHNMRKMIGQLACCLSLMLCAVMHKQAILRSCKGNIRQNSYGLSMNFIYRSVFIHI